MFAVPPVMWPWSPGERIAGVVFARAVTVHGKLTLVVAVPWDAVDTWIEEGRRLVHYPPNPYHRVDCRPTTRRLRVAVGGVTLVDTDAFVEYFITAGKKGIAVNRYKGLGEMNAETLWSTTMDPEVRTLLEVRAEDHAEADQMFTTLMGDQVEPRRKFIEDNALDVRNLDV